MKETVLLFHISSKEQRIKIGKALFPLNIAVKAVPKEKYLQPVGHLAGRKDMSGTEEIYEGEELDGEMLLMAGIQGVKMDRVLEALKKAGVTKSCLKAVLTDTNRFWNVPELHEEIKKEHAAMRK